MYNSITKKILKKIVATTLCITYRFCILFSGKRKAEIDLNHVKKVLIILLHYTGDVLFATPVIRTVKQVLPQAQIDVWVKSRAEDIVKDNLYINKIYVYDYIITRRWEDRYPLDLRGKRKLLKQFMSEQYDLVIDFSGVIGSTLFTYFMKPKYSVGFNKQGLGFLFTKEAEKSGKGHLVDQYLSVLECLLGIQSTDSSLELRINEETEAFVDELFRAKKIDSERFVLCLHTTAGWKAKEWAASKFRELIQWIQSELSSCQIIIIGDKADFKKVTRICEGLPQKPIDFVGKLSLAETSAAIAKSHLFIGSDSAPLHIAAALDVPTISLFGPTNPLFSAPRGKKHVYIYKTLDCSAKKQEQYCKRNAGLTCSTYDCMKLISVDEVFHYVKTAVENHKSSETEKARRTIQKKSFSLLMEGEKTI